jgi:membrane protein DedA with SNARE-associated domain
VTATLTHLIAAYGLPALLLLMTLDSCGFPLPSEAIMPIGGALAAAGHLQFPAVVAAGSLASLLGALVAYGAAARFGAPLLLGPGRWIGFRSHHLALANRWFSRYGRWAVLTGRMVPVVRGYVSFPAGLAGLPVVPFSLLTLAGSVPWCAGLATAGYLLGANYHRVSGPLGAAAAAVAALVLLLLAAWFVAGRRASDAG